MNVTNRYYMIFGTKKKTKEIKDGLETNLKEFEEMLIDMNKNGYITN